MYLHESPRVSARPKLNKLYELPPVRPEPVEGSAIPFLDPTPLRLSLVAQQPVAART
jgi:hypothetical protein